MAAWEKKGPFASRGGDSNTVAVGTGLTGCVRIGLGWRCNVPNRDCRETACETGPLAKRVKVGGHGMKTDCVVGV